MMARRIRDGGGFVVIIVDYVQLLEGEDGQGNLYTQQTKGV
jgi:hypothetical protein